MKQYTIKPIEWSIDPDSEVRLNPNVAIDAFIEDVYMSAFAHIKVNGGEYMRTEWPSIQVAKEYIQAVWEDWLKQYLEEAK